MKSAVVLILSAVALVVSSGAEGLDESLESLVKGWKGAKPSAPRKVLFFNTCYGFNHEDGRRYGEWSFRRAGEVSGAWTCTWEKDGAKLTDAAYLAAFDAIVLCNSTGLQESTAPGLAKAFSDFVAKQGKGIAIIHSGLDAFKDSDELLDLFGGYFRGHPWHGGGTWRFLNEQPANPINASFRQERASFSRSDEIYQFPAFYDRRSCNVLISLDMTDQETKAAEQRWENRCGPGSTRADHDYAVSWTRTPGKGRVFYTSFGHDRRAFLDPTRLYHMFAGLQYVLGDLPAKTGRVFAADIPDQRADWANGPWRDRILGEVKAAKGRRFKLVTVGDSIWMMWRFAPDWKYPGGKVSWERHFGDKALNLGVSGDCTENVLWRIGPGGEADGWTADNIFVICGGNNSWKKKPDGADADTPALAAKGMGKIVETLRTKHPESRIVIVGLLPLDCARKWIDEYNGLIRGLADGQKVVFRDYGREIFLTADGKQDRSLFNPDTVHPNPKGYEKFALAIEKDL